MNDLQQQLGHNTWVRETGSGDSLNLCRQKEGLKIALSAHKLFDVGGQNAHHDILRHGNTLRSGLGLGHFSST